MKRLARVLALLVLFAAYLPLASCGGGGGSDGGYVHSLTGDPDDQVSSHLQDQVRRAFARSEFDPPIDD